MTARNRWDLPSPAASPSRAGGVYADLDVEALKPIDLLLEGSEPVLAFMSSTWWLRHNIPNAWFASPPGHPFWQVCTRLSSA